MAANKKVIFITNYPLESRDAKRLGFEIWVSQNYEIQVWDISRYYYKNLQNITMDLYKSKNIEIFKIKKIFKIKSELKKVTKGDVVVVCGTTNKLQSVSTFLIFYLISNSQAVFSNVLWGDLPLHNEQSLKSIASKINTLFSLKSLDIVKLMRVSYSIFWREFSSLNFGKYKLRKIIGIKAFDFVWLGTLPDRVPKIFISEKTKFIYIHNLDFDKIIAVEEKNVRSKSSIVLLDSMGPLHTDYMAEDRLPSIGSELYSQLVRNILDKIENKFDTKVIIAAHPRTNFDICEKLYGNREVFFNQTAELISQSNAVIIIDGSTSVGFAVYWKKPIIIIKSNKFDIQTKNLNEYLIQLLNPNVIDLDLPFTLENIRSADVDLYDEYFWQYVKKPNTPKKYFWQIVISELEKIN